MQLVFQPLIVIAGSLTAFVSFIFLAQTIHKFGRQEIVELEKGEDLKTQKKSEHNTIIQEGCKLLAKLFTPLLIVFAIDNYWLYADVHLNPLPFGLDNVADLVIIGSIQAALWTFQTYIYLYVCVLFWEVCKLQLLRMKHFEDTLSQGRDAEDYFAAYKRILNFLDSASYHFRWFLALSGCITVFCDLASLYEIVNHLRTGTGILMTADLMVLNVVNMTGWGLCLRSASKVVHMHRNIVQTASWEYAQLTYSGLKCSSFLGQDKEIETSQGIQRLSDYQAACKLFVHQCCRYFSIWPYT